MRNLKLLAGTVQNQLVKNLVLPNFIYKILEPELKYVTSEEFFNKFWIHSRYLSRFNWPALVMLARKFSDTTLLIPDTSRRINQTELLNLTLKNLIVINSQYIKYSIEYNIVFYMGSYFSNESSAGRNAASVLIQCIASVLLFRIQIRTLALNLFNTLAIVNRMNEVEKDTFVQVHTLCDQCETKAKFIDSITIQVHYVTCLLMMTGLTWLVGSSQIGMALNFFLLSYFKGFIFWQYALAAEGVCPQHQRQVLLNDRGQCFAFGFIFNSVLIVASFILNYLFGRVLANIFQDFLTNIIGLFAIIHVVNMKFTLPNASSLVNSECNFDLVDLMWQLTAWLVKEGIVLFRRLLKSENRPSAFITWLIQVLNGIVNSWAFSVLIKILVPFELRNAEAFFQIPEIREHSAYFIEQMKDITIPATEAYNSLLLQPMLMIYRNIGFAQNIMHVIATKKVRSSYDIPREIVILLIKIIFHPEFGNILNTTNRFVLAVRPALGPESNWQNIEISPVIVLDEIDHIADQEKRSPQSDWVKLRERATKARVLCQGSLDNFIMPHEYHQSVVEQQTEVFVNDDIMNLMTESVPEVKAPICSDTSPPGLGNICCLFKKQDATQEIIADNLIMLNYFQQ